MKKLLAVAAISILVVLLIASFASAAPSWRIQFRCTAPGAGGIGNVYFGALSSSNDAKDAGDVPVTGSVGSYVRFVESRTDLGGTAMKQDMRELYSDGTKVWSNLVIEGSLASATAVTLAWVPGASTYSLPTGTYKLIDLDSGQEYDLSAAGSLTFTASGTAAYRHFVMYAAIGTGPTISKLVNVAALGKLQSSVIADSTTAYFGDENGKIQKVDLASGAAAPALFTSGAAFRGRLALYDGVLYGVDSAGTLFWASVDGTYSGSLALGANPNSVPAVVKADGHTYIYVGTSTGLAQVVDGVAGTTFATTAAVGSPAVPTTDGLAKVWFGSEDGNLYCVTPSLETALATLPIGGKVSDPMVDPWWGLVSAGGATNYGAYHWDTLAAANTTPIGANISSAPYVDYASKVAYFQAIDNKVYAVNTATGSAAPGWPVALDGTSTRTTAPVLTDAKVIVTGGATDSKLYIIDKATTTKTWLSGNGAFAGSPSVSLNGERVVVGSTDGNIYLVNVPAAAAGPMISTIVVSNITASGATISWTTNVPADSQIQYGTGSYTNSTTLDTTMVTSHSQAITGLSAGNTYHFSVLSRDASGNLTPSADAVFMTPPVVTDDGATTTNTAQLHATWAPMAGAVEYQYAIGTTAGGAEVAAWASAGDATSITKTGLSLTTTPTYYISVKAKSATGVWSPAGTSNGIKVAAAPGGKWDVAVVNDGAAAAWSTALLGQMSAAPYTASFAVTTIETNVVATGLAGYDVLVLPANHGYAWLDTATSDAIKAFVSAGGTLIIDSPKAKVQDPLTDAFGADYWLGWVIGSSTTATVSDASNLLVSAPNILAASNLNACGASNLIQDGGSQWKFAAISGTNKVLGYADYGSGRIIACGANVEATGAPADAQKLAENMIVIGGSR